MKLLLIVPSYPWSAGVFAGIFNQRCATALRDIGAYVEVLAPRPYSPRLLHGLRPRWKAYAEIPRSQREDGILIHRPAFLQIPRLASTFWRESGAFVSCKRVAAERHGQVGFDAVLSFDLLGAGGLAWRLGRHLGVFAAGWATGDDIRVAADEVAGRALVRTLRNLDMVFYQSKELFGLAGKLLAARPEDMDPQRHVILSRGISEPPPGDRAEMRARMRTQLGLRPEEVMVLSLGRIEAAKGVGELLAAAARLSVFPELLRIVLVGSSPGFDDTREVERSIKADPALGSRVLLLPSCPPADVWQYFAAADIFAFSSHNEGMPNSLLEAMAMELPAVAFAIPPIVEIDGETEVVIKVPPFDVEAFTGAIRRLARDADERRRRGAAGPAIVRDRFLVRRNMAVALDRIEHGIRLSRRAPSLPWSSDRGRASF